MNEVVICKRNKCKDYITDEGEPAWCSWAGCPACVAITKCPKVTGDKSGRIKCQSEGPITKIGKNKK